MVFEFLKKKFQDLTSAAVPADSDALPVALGGYEERRSEAEALHERGETARAIELLEGLAADLAGDGSFPLAVAVRHQISSWSSGPPVAQTAAEDGATMARQREASGVMKALPKGYVQAALVPEGLRTSRFFADMTSEEIAGFIASTGRRTFHEGELVIEQGEEGRSLFIVTRGVLGVVTKGSGGGTLRMGVLTMGDVFGEVAFLTGRPRTATVIAETGAECLEIASDAWTGILGKYPRVQKVLEEVHRERARSAADAILEDLRRRREDKGV